MAFFRNRELEIAQRDLNEALAANQELRDKASVNAELIKRGHFRNPDSGRIGRAGVVPAALLLELNEELGRLRRIRPD